MAKIIWADPALDQLEAIANYIALDDTVATREFVQEVFAQTERIKSFPNLGQRVPELKSSTHRQIWLKPCWLYYRVTGDTIYIVHLRRAERPLRRNDLKTD